ncbi:profilin-like [Pollicipes pollicipes]|uniref:profilin-like n=1 Tax=Pollicipes pollicipes TaxID=41117 RepID=UPI001884BA90|nr:profilin-like [Pollicipes pollicipes]
MSWQDYISKQLISTNMVRDALIAGVDGAIWAQSKNLKATKQELLPIIKGIKDGGGGLTAGGVHFSGTKYIFLSGVANKCIRAKKAKVGLHASMTSKTVVVALYADPVQHGECAAVVEKFSDFLKSKNY